LGTKIMSQQDLRNEFIATLDHICSASIGMTLLRG
jgi:hypothetical protein